MQKQITFTDAGWDFVNETANGPNDIWTINDSFGYPKFIWERVNLVGWYEVDFGDYATLTSEWMSDCPRQCNRCDIVEDGHIDFTDFAVIANNWNIYDCNYCDGADLSGDNDVNAEDLMQFTGCWLAPYDCSGSDIDFSGAVDALDLAILCQNWLRE